MIPAPPSLQRGKVLGKSRGQRRLRGSCGWVAAADGGDLRGSAGARDLRRPGTFSPRSQTPFGNAIAGETLFRWWDAGRGWTRSPGNGVAGTRACPNGVWAREGKRGGKLAGVSLPGVLARSWSFGENGVPKPEFGHETYRAKSTTSPCSLIHQTHFPRARSFASLFPARLPHE